MASRIASRWKHFLLIFTVFLLIGVQVLTTTDEHVFTPYKEIPMEDRNFANLTGKEECSSEEISYFKEIALRVEYGSELNRIHKWTEELRLKIMGDPGSEDLLALESTLRTLNTLSKNLKLRYVRKDEQSNVQVYFIPHSEFLKYTSIEESILKSNWGLGAIWWNEEGEIFHAEVFIATDLPNAEERAHLIREELTQSLGVLNDSWKHPESLFYQGWGIQDFTELDKKVVKVLYQDGIRPNMQEEEIERILARLNPSVLSFIAIPERS